MQGECNDARLLDLEARLLALEQANRDLAASNERLRAIFENEPECVKVLAADGTLLDMNPAGLRMLEADSLAQVLSHCLYPLIVEEHREAFRALNAKVLAGGSGVLEFEIIGLKGGRRWLETHASPLRDATGAITATLGITRDISTRKRAESELVQSEQQLARQLSEMEQLYRTAPVGLALLDADLRFVRVNERLAAINGRSVADHIGRSLDEIVPGLSGELQEIYRRVLDTGLPVLDLEINGVTPAEPQVERNWLASYLPVRDNDGQVVGVSAVVVEITERKQAEEELGQLRSREREAKQQVDRIIESVSDAFVALDKDWRYTYVNRRAGEIFQRRPEDLVGKHIWTEFPEGVGQPFQRVYEQALTMQVPQTIEEYYPRYDAWFENRIYPHPDGLSIVFQNITDRKRAEDQLRRSAQQLQMVMDGLGPHMMVGLLDTQGVALMVNRPALAVASLRAEDVIGRPVEDTYWWAYSESVRLRVQQAVRRAALGEAVRYDERIRVADDALIWIDFSIHPLRDDRGAVVSLVPSGTVIHERKLAEQALQASETQLGMIYAHAADAVFLLEVAADGFRFVSVNPRFLAATGLTSAQVVGKRVDQVIPQPALDLVLQHYARAIHSGQPVFWEEVSEYPSGTRYGEVTVAPVMDDAGRCSQLIGTVHDVTAGVHAKQQLRAAASRQKSLAQRLAEVQEAEQRQLSTELHDRIGQNLTALSINLNIIGSPNAQPDATAARLQESRKLLETTIASVRDLVTELRPAVLDDYGLLAGLRWVGEQVRARTGLQISVVGEEPLPRLEQPVESALFRIAQEALNNVVKHAQAGQAWLTLHCETGRLTLGIADDGVGFDSTAPQRPGPRTHWGLEMMRERAELVGGRLRVESATGLGTSVFVDLERAP